MCLPTSQNPSCWHPPWLNNACTTRKDSESEWLGKDNPETNPITIKHEIASRASLLVSLTLLLSTPCSCPNKISCFVSICVSSDSSFLNVRLRAWSWALIGVGGVPLPATNGDSLLCSNWHPNHLGYLGTSLPADGPDQWPQLGPFCPWSPPDADN